MGEPAQLEWHDTDTYNSADRQPSNDLDLGCLRQQGRQCGSFPGRAKASWSATRPVRHWVIQDAAKYRLPSIP